MIDKEEVKRVVEEKIEGSALFLVDVTVSRDNEIVVTVDSDEDIDIDTCVLLSKHIESVFDREKEDYDLEVGSAGLSSPFKVVRQYKKYIGEEIEVLTNGSEKLVGKLAEVGDESFVMVMTEKIKPEGAKRKVEVETRRELVYSEVKQAKYSIRIK